MRTVHNGQNYRKYYDLLIWNMIPGYIEDSELWTYSQTKIENGCQTVAHFAFAKNLYQI